MIKYDQPIDLDKQAELMQKYVVFNRKTRIKKLLRYTGYFRLSRYGKYLLSFTNVLMAKPTQQLLFDVYAFDVELRKLFFSYSKKAEIQFKSHLSNAVSLDTGEDTFYLNRLYYNESKGDSDKNKRNANRIFFDDVFFKNLQKQERKLRQNVSKYPELRDYRGTGSRSKKKLPCWAAFSYFEFGLVTNIYGYLRGDLRKRVLIYGYTRKNYGKEVTKQVDTWLDAIRNLRNCCAHHNRLIGKTSSVVLHTYADEGILLRDTDLLSRLYALKKILNERDGETLKKDLDRLMCRAKFDVYMFGILPKDWKERYARIKRL